jgi:hypothetical protein
MHPDSLSGALAKRFQRRGRRRHHLSHLGKALRGARFTDLPAQATKVERARQCGHQWLVFSRFVQDYGTQN